MPRLLEAVLLSIAALVSAHAETARVVVIKADGLGASVLDRWLNERDPSTGKSALPWIDHVFVANGTRLNNFYVRGISLSVPSWSLLDSGFPALIRGNAEYDRVTGRVYDYMNFVPFYFLRAKNLRADMPAVEVLDQAGVPLLIDAFGRDQRLQGMQLFQRGVRWDTLRSTLTRRVRSRTMRQLFNEWQTGFELTSAVNEQVERELVSALADSKVAYLDYFFGGFDHVMHLTNDEASERKAAKELDALVGRLWSAIGRSPLADRTALVLVSDHGMNSDPATYSQGYSLINFFGSSAGGGHHVLTNRYPMEGYKLKGLDPFVYRVVTPSPESKYLTGEAESYPTALLDLDGNERASIYLRNSDVNEMHMLLKRAASQRDVSQREAASQFIALVNRHRGKWHAEAEQLQEELAALRRAIDRKRATTPMKRPKFTAEERASGMADRWTHDRSQLGLWEYQLQTYDAHLAWLREVLKAKPANVASLKMPVRAALDRNRIHELQNYSAGYGPEDFQSINYLRMLKEIRVRNNVQDRVGPEPVDLIAVPVSQDALRAALPEEDWPDRGGVFVYGGEERQALILGRGELIRYFPVRRLRQDESGKLEFERAALTPGFPLRYFEDPDFAGNAAEFLSGWHSEREWFDATHRTRYSNGVIGLFAHFAPPFTLSGGDLWAGAPAGDEPLLRRFVDRLRANASADMLVLANDHWNFNVRGFNPGGNHGSFFRISTHSVLMFAGGGVPKGRAVERPYDSLSFAPTVLELMGRKENRGMPGPLIEELFPGREAHGAASAPRQ